MSSSMSCLSVEPAKISTCSERQGLATGSTVEATETGEAPAALEAWIRSGFGESFAPDAVLVSSQH